MQRHVIKRLIWKTIAGQAFLLVITILLPSTLLSADVLLSPALKIQFNYHCSDLRYTLCSLPSIE